MICLRLSRSGKGSGLDTNTLSAENVEHQGAGSVVLVDGLVALGELDVLEVLVEEVGAVHGTALGLGVELGREDGAGLVHHALVATVVEVDKVLLELAGESAGVNGVTVVLAGDVALASGQVKGGNVVSTVAVLELNGAGTDGEGQKLVAQANTHDGDGRGLHQASEVVDSVLAVSRVTGTVRDEDTIKVLSDLVDGVVVGEDGDGGASADQAAENVLLDTAVDEGNVQRGTGRLDNEGSLGADALDQVDLARVDEALILIGIVLVTNGDPSEGGTLLSEVGDNGTGIDARDGGNTLSGAPLSQTLNGGPMAVVDSNVGDDNTGALDVGGLEVLEEVVLVSGVGGNTIVANEGLGEDEDLASVGGVGHGLGVANQGGSEDSLARDVCVGAEGLALEDGTISDGESRRKGSDRSSSPGRGEGHLPALAASNGLLRQVSDLKHRSARSRRGLGRGFGKGCQSGEHFDVG